MTDIIIQGICGRMGPALMEKSQHGTIAVWSPVWTARLGRSAISPVLSGFEALPCRGVIIDFSSPPGLWLQYSMVPSKACPA